MHRNWMNSIALLVVCSALSFGLTREARAADGSCDPAALEQKVGACGIDIGCINQAMAEYNANCMGGSDSGGSGGMGGMGMGMGGMDPEVMERLQACGGDPQCAQEVMESLQGGSEEDEFDTTKRMSEKTVLAPSWLQSYQEALVTCAKDVACWTTMMSGAIAHTQAVCGTNFMSKATITCQIAARYEIHIEQAIAQQRLWRKGIRFEENAPGATPPEGTPSTETSEGTDSPTPPEVTDEVFSFLPTVTKADVRKILSKEERRLENLLPKEARDKVDEGARDYPLDADAELPPLIYEETETDSGLELSGRPTRRDWYYALTGVLLTQAGFLEEGSKRDQILDAALWSLIQAAQLKPEAEHYSNIGFHLNLRGDVEKARDVLAYARSLDPSLADAHNNLAFSYSALGKPEEALTLQRNAARLAPDDNHIRSRLDSMTGESTKGGDPMPYGGDFGEAFFRLGKRHALREFEEGLRWYNARQKAKHGIFGGTPTVVGPHSWYEEQLRDIRDDYSTCEGVAPEVAKGCPFGSYILHPSCANAASPEEVARTQHNRDVALCRCAANSLMARADALSAYLDRSIAAWRGHEDAWWPRLQHFVKSWSQDIKNVNKRYEGTNFVFPVESAYWFWPEQFGEDSEDAWTSEIPDIAAQWYELKTAAQNLKSCGTTLPPIKKPPKKPKPKPAPKVKSYGINLFVVEFNIGMDGSFKLGVDLGIIKGSYERIPGVDGHKFEIGSGPIDFSYQTNGSPRPGQDSTQVSMTVGANFFKFIPGAGKIAGNIADQFVSFGGKYQATWGNRTGIQGKATVESKSKFGFSTRDIRLAPSTHMLN